ncbi:hypothetical protein KY346_01800 [Candidatus Woesearchaeota archaeon]|nr:hypothetical protein [Candidatus Woesearchaeota archaeon]
MEFKKLIDEIEATPEFKEWKKDHPDFYLAHVFVMPSEDNVWQIGYYDKKSNKVDTIIKQGNKIEIMPAQDILKASQEIMPLKPEEVKLTVSEALEKAKACIKENYPKEILLKHFLIIQHLEGATVFNITYVTQSFKTVNIKIDSADGKIIKHSMEKLADFG